MQPHERLHTGADFRRVFKEGVRLDGPLFVLIAAENRLGCSRIGLAASRRIGGAVSRNRSKRLLRESFRRHKPEPPGLDLVFVPKREIVESRQEDVDREYRSRLRRAHQQARRGRTHPSRPH